MDMKLGHTQTLIASAKAHSYLRNETAYLLATSFHETGHTMEPVREAYWVKNAEAWRKEHLRYYPYYGRGYIQLTWERNYKLAADKLGQPIDTNLDLALDPTIAADIAVLGMKEGWFTGKKLSDYVDLQHSDFVEARRIINGTDQAQRIAGYATQYDSDLKAIWTD
jgi:putative chitinase